MIRLFLAMFTVVLAGTSVRSAWAEVLPFCSNRTIQEVTGRVGCTVGDARCWLRKGGFCTDYVHIKLNLKRDEAGGEVSWTPVLPADVGPGDIAVFIARTHYAYVEKINRDKQGRPVTVDVSEYNFGTCLVDEQIMVTDQYKLVNRRKGVPINSVDGGFIRSSR